MIELRCNSKKHGELAEPGTGVLEVKCKSRFCGAAAGAVILHDFDLATGELVRTRKFKEPKQERNDDGAYNAQPAVRSA